MLPVRHAIKLQVNQVTQQVTDSAIRMTRSPSEQRRRFLINMRREFSYQLHAARSCSARSALDWPAAADITGASGRAISSGQISHQSVGRRSQRITAPEVARSMPAQ